MCIPRLSVKHWCFKEGQHLPYTYLMVDNTQIENRLTLYLNVPTNSPGSYGKIVQTKQNCNFLWQQYRINHNKMFQSWRQENHVWKMMKKRLLAQDIRSTKYEDKPAYFSDIFISTYRTQGVVRFYNVSLWRALST